MRLLWRAIMNATTAQKLPYTFCIVALLFAACFAVVAQKKHSLPADLNQNSSVAEIMKWLEPSFGKAHIVLKDSWDDA